jgi:hypothetical protein
VLTFATATNTLVAGQQVPLSGFSGGAAFLNGQTVTVLAVGLTTTAFEANVIGVPGTTSAGSAAIANFTTTLLTPTQLVGGAIYTPSLGFSGNDIEIDHIGFDNGPTLSPGAPITAFTVSCTTALTAPCGHGAKLHDNIALGNTTAAAVHAMLICEGYDNCDIYNNQAYLDEDGIVFKATGSRFHDNKASGHSLSDFYMKSDFYAPNNNNAITGNVGGVILPGDTGVGFTLQALDAPATGVSMAGNSFFGTTNGIFFQGGSTSNAISGLSVAGTSFNGVGTAFECNGFVQHVDIPGFSVINGNSWSSISQSSSPNCTDLHIGHVTTDLQSSNGAWSVPSNRVDDAYGLSASSGAIIQGPIVPITLIDASGPPWVIGKAQSSVVGATGTCTIATTVMTCTAITTGAFSVGQSITGTSVTANSIITSLGTGTGGAGTYNLNQSSTVATGETITSTQANGALISTGGILVNSFDITFSVVTTCTSLPAIFVLDSTTGGRLNANYSVSAATVAGVTYRVTAVGGSSLLPVNPGDTLTIENGTNQSSCTDGTVGTVDHVAVYGQPY